MADHYIKKQTGFQFVLLNNYSLEQVFYFAGRKSSADVQS